MIATLRKSLVCARLAVLSQLEYRFNFLSDTVIQPVIMAMVEVALWWTVFASLAEGVTTIGGFGREAYLAYAMWGAMFARIYTSWMYEGKMVTDIETGSVNRILVRPVSFYHYYLAQFMGYKLLTTSVTLIVWSAVMLVMEHEQWIDVAWSRLPLALALSFFYLLVVHTISVCVASFGFRFNNVRSFTMTKNFSLWILSGEMFPLDLTPEPFRSILIHLPFSSGVYIPCGYLTGRFGVDVVVQGFVSSAVGLAFFGVLATWLWNSGVKAYTGTGA